ncbi:MAG: hypothetical protein IPM91_10695 [Bacteroidetes bacterium]|nr:hypothetical protein [Bacteroidota bacterium]
MKNAMNKLKKSTVLTGIVLLLNTVIQMRKWQIILPVRAGVGAGDLNVGLGHDALKLSNSGNANFAVGASALSYNTTGSGNTAIGYTAYKNKGGSHNVLGGTNALLNNTSGSRNVVHGNCLLFQYHRI